MAVVSIVLFYHRLHMIAIGCIKNIHGLLQLCCRIVYNRKAMSPNNKGSITKSIRLPKEMHDRIERLAEAETRSFNLQLQHLLKIAFKALDGEKKARRK